MKEATGEANMTVITIILIALVLAIGTPIITNLIAGVSSKADCNNNGSYWYGGECHEDPQ